MILYATKKTFDRYKLKTPDEMSSELNIVARMVVDKESNDPLFKWGAKLFYFDRRKCLQVVNFASKFTLFLIDIKVSDLPMVGNLMANYMLYIYNGDIEMQHCLEKMFDSSPVCIFDHLHDRKIVATLNRTQLDFAFDGYRFYDFVENNILNTREINRRINMDWIFGEKIGNKKEYYCAADKFRELVVNRFGTVNAKSE